LQSYYNNEGTNGGAGATVTLTNAVAGHTMGSLALRQSATGGAGGDAVRAAAGAAGRGISKLTVADTAAASLDVTAGVTASAVGDLASTSSRRAGQRATASG